MKIDRVASVMPTANRAKPTAFAIRVVDHYGREYGFLASGTDNDVALTGVEAEARRFASYGIARRKLAKLEATPGHFLHPDAPGKWWASVVAVD